MKRLLVLAACVVAAVACDPLLPLRVKDEVQPVNSLNLVSDSLHVRSGMTLDFQIVALDGGQHEIDLSDKEITISFTNQDAIAATQVGASTVRVSGKKVGSSTLTVTIDGVSSSATLTVSPGLPSKVELTSGGSQLGVANDPLLQPLVFQVKDGFDNNVGANVTVSFTTTSGSVSPTALTNASGQVTVSYTPGAAGSQSVTASVGSASSAQVAVPVTVTTLQPALSATLTNPRSGVTMTPAPVVQLQYASNGQPYPRSGKTVTVTLTVPTGRTITNGTITTNSAGIATFDALRITGTVGAITMRFTVSGAGTSVDAPVTLLGGLPASLSITTQPVRSVTGRVFPTPPVVQLLDASGNESPEANVSVSAAASTGTVANQIAITDANGRATFSTLTVTGTSGSRTLAFTSPSHPSVSSTTSSAFILTGVETRVLMDRTTTSFACSVVPTTTPRVQLYDAAGNTVPQPGVTVTAAFAAGTAAGTTIEAGGSAVTDATGLATFSTLKVRGAAAGYTLDFTSGTLTKATMSTSLVHGVADSLDVVTQPPTTAQNGVNFTTTPTVRVYDDCGNLVTGTDVDITATTTTAGPVFLNGTRTTVGGTATFSNLQMNGIAGSYKLRFTSPGLVADTANLATALAKGNAARVVLTTEPSTTSPSNTVLTTQPIAKVVDVGGNGITGARTITATVASPANGATLSSATATVAAADSIGTFAGLKLSGIAGAYSLVFSSAGLVDDTSTAPLTLTGGNTATKITLDTNPSTGVFSSGGFARPPVIQLRDASNNVVLLPNISVTVTAAGNPYTIINGTRTTDANGKASFSTLAVSGSSQTSGTLTFTVTGLTAVSAPLPTVIVASALANNTPFAINDVAGTNRYYAITVPAGRATLTVSIASGTGDADIYVRASDLPTTTVGEFACSGVTLGSSNESCTINAPAAGTYFILVRGIANYSGQLKAAYP